MMKNPVHPGELVKHDCLEALGLSVTKAASVLGVSRPTLSRVINGRAAVSPEMAIRLSKAFGSRPETWLKMQLAHDLAQARRMANQIKVQRYPSARSQWHDDVH
jgi:addiction module HigA family antidote